MHRDVESLRLLEGGLETCRPLNAGNLYAVLRTVGEADRRGREAVEVRAGQAHGREQIGG